MNGVMELVQFRATTQGANTFAVHPPQKMLDNPKILESDNAIEELTDSVFSIAFQDGTAKTLGLPELMAFVFNLITLSMETKNIHEMLAASPHQVPTSVNLNFKFSMRDIMQPEMVKVLLSKTTFSNTSSDQS